MGQEVVVADGIVIEEVLAGFDSFLIHSPGDVRDNAQAVGSVRALDEVAAT